MASLTFDSTIKLNNGTSIPVLGFGTWKMSPQEAESAVPEALKTGYRHVDTAALYANEREVGRAVRESGIERGKIFVTTKLWNSDQTQAEKAFAASLSKLGLEYVDLYLIHWPQPGTRSQAWKSLQKIYSGGKAKAVGVSNYTVRHLEELLAESELVPAVNQVEFSPFLYQKELLEFCARHGIVLEAYSPLTRGKRLNDPLLAEIGARHSKTPAQIVLRWSIQHGCVPLPKSSHTERIRENAGFFDFELSGKEMKEIDGLDESYRVTWDPSTLE